MMPSTSDTLWSHVPSWLWPVIIVGVVAFFVYEAVKASEAVAKFLGPMGRRIHERAVAPKKTLDRVAHIEEVLERTSDQLECATTYLVLDAAYHREEDIILAEKYPGAVRLLPKRMPYSDFSRMWRTGWRPENGFNL